MASPCEVMLQVEDKAVATRLLNEAASEAKRIETKFSRYRDDNILYQINHSGGKAITVDEETSKLLDYAQACFQISDGLFDITSGILRYAWQFDGRRLSTINTPNNSADTHFDTPLDTTKYSLPSALEIKKLRQHIGWQKVQWQAPQLILPDGMEIDLGGIGKEYAVDSTLKTLQRRSAEEGIEEPPILVNFGGDLAANRPPLHQSAWKVGVELPSQEGQAWKQLSLVRGAIATSGDARRYLIIDGKRYSHILNPHSGWPISGGPSSVSVVGQTCTEAGVLATLSLLHGAEAESFLKEQHVQYWCYWQ